MIRKLSGHQGFWVLRTYAAYTPYGVHTLYDCVFSSVAACAVGCALWGALFSLPRLYVYNCNREGQEGIRWRIHVSQEEERCWRLYRR